MTPQHEPDRHLGRLFTHFTGDLTPLAQLKAALQRQPGRRRPLLWSRIHRSTWSALRAELDLQHGSAHSLARRAVNRSLLRQLLHHTPGVTD